MARSTTPSSTWNLASRDRCRGCLAGINPTHNIATGLFFFVGITFSDVTRGLQRFLVMVMLLSGFPEEIHVVQLNVTLFLKVSHARLSRDRHSRGNPSGQSNGWR